MFSQTTKSIADIGQSLINGVIGRNGNDNSTGVKGVMRAKIPAGAATIIRYYTLHSVIFDLQAEPVMALPFFTGESQQILHLIDLNWQYSK